MAEEVVVKSMPLDDLADVVERSSTRQGITVGKRNSFGVMRTMRIVPLTRKRYRVPTNLRSQEGSSSI